MWTGVWEVSFVAVAIADESAFETKIVTATPSGNFMVFDINRGKLGTCVSMGAS